MCWSYDKDKDQFLPSYCFNSVHMRNADEILNN